MKDFEHHIGTKHFRLVRTCARLGPARARKALHSREKFAVPDSRKIRWKRHFVVSWIIIIIRDFLYINPLWLIYDSDHSTSKLSKYKLFSFIHGIKCDFDPDNSLARVLIKCYISRVTRSRADPKIFAMCCITHCEKWDQCIRVFQPSMIFIFDNLVPRHLG